MTKLFIDKIILDQAFGIPDVGKMILSAIILSSSYYGKFVSNLSINPIFH